MPDVRGKDLSGRQSCVALLERRDFGKPAEPQLQERCMARVRGTLCRVLDCHAIVAMEQHNALIEIAKQGGPTQHV